MTERRLEEMMLATIALFFLLIRRAVKRNSIWGGLRRLLTSCQLDIDFNTLAAAGTKRTALLVDNVDVQSQKLKRLERVSQKQPLSSFYHPDCMAQLRGNVFNLRPPASSKRREKKRSKGKKAKQLEYRPTICLQSYVTYTYFSAILKYRVPKFE